MNWTKIPTNLLISRIPDNELIAIVKYQLLWADLEYQPTDEIALRYMTNKQVSLAKHYLNDLEAQVVADINSTIKHRGGQKTYYKKKQLLTTNNDNQYDNQCDGQCDNHADRADKIREEIKENIYKRKFTVDSIITVNGQDFNQFPPESMPLLKKYWTDSKIESIRKDLAAIYPHETTIAVLLTKYESDKSKKKKFAPPTLDEWLEYSAEKGLKLKKMEEAYEAYEVAGWHDSQGKPILNWKQKILNVWCKDENREAFPTKPQTI